MIGYCWGGYVAWMAPRGCRVLRARWRITAAASWTRRRKNHAVPSWRTSVSATPGIPVAGVRELMKTHPEAKIFIYAADHGFNCDQRAAYEPAAAKLARERTRFLRRHVG